MDFYPNKRICSAIVVGINDYDKNKKLRNAVNDAVAISKTLEELCYDVSLLTDCTKDQFDEVFFKTIDPKVLKDIIILYFAGHGLYCNGSDCIVFKDATSISEIDGLPALQKSWRIEEIYKTIRSKQDNAIVIAIIDACRIDYVGEEGGERGLRPANSFNTRIKLPYQTFIAFATSPHAPAYDGKGIHSQYTEALIKEIGQLNQSVETTFKNVRKAIYKGPPDQLPWEHSCLVDEFSFNFGQTGRHFGSIYSDEAYLNRLKIKELDAANYSALSQGLRTFISDIESHSVDEQFVFGRGIIKLSAKYPQLVPNFINSNTLRYSMSSEISHVLNGMLYQLYFNDKDEYSEAIFNYNTIDAIHNILSDDSFVESRKFIQLELEKIPQHSGYTPGTNNIVKFKLEFSDSGMSDVVFLTSITSRGVNVGFDNGLVCGLVTYSELRDYLWHQSRVPHMLLSVETSLEIDDGVDIVVGEIDEDWISERITNYFLEENRDPLDSLGHHYEFSAVISSDIVKYIPADDGIEVRGTTLISTIVYLDKEEETQFDIQFNGEFSIFVNHHFTKAGIELEVTDIRVILDTSEY